MYTHYTDIEKMSCALLVVGNMYGVILFLCSKPQCVNIVIFFRIVTTIRLFLLYGQCLLTLDQVRILHG